MTKSFALEAASSGIRYNTITPGFIATDMTDELSDEIKTSFTAKIPMGRFGEVDEIAALVAWLCTEDCSFSTGAVFDLSGGRAVY